MTLDHLSSLYTERSDLRNSGRFADAIPIQREILLLVQDGDCTKDVSNAWNYLSMLLYRTGQYAEAEHASRESIAVYGHEANPSDETLATYEMLLARLLAAQSNFRDAVLFGTRAIRHFSTFHDPPDDFLKRMEQDVELMVQCRNKQT